MYALGLIDPNKLLQPEITVTWVAIYAKVATESPSGMEIFRQKGPPPATIWDPLRTWHGPRHRS